MKRGIKRILPAVFCVALLLVVAVFGLFKYQQLEPKRQDLQRISQDAYDSAFFSMYPISGYSEEEFSLYRGTDTIFSEYLLPDIDALMEYMEAVAATENEIHNMFFGVDPATIWDACGKNTEKWNGAMERMVACFGANPQVRFDIMLAYPDIAYWIGMSAQEMESTLNLYRNFISWVEGYSNVVVYYLGAEQWLIENPDSYMEEYCLNPTVSKKVMLYTFCDGQFRVNGENIGTILDELVETVRREQTTPAKYPDLSEWKLVCVGDSVIGNYKGSFSVPGVVSALTGGECYNYAIGGTLASDYPEYDNSFLDIVEQFINGELLETRDNICFPYQQISCEEEKLCFLIHYGLNDYFSGASVEDVHNPQNVETYGGALREGIDRLQQAYPNAVIVLMTPPFCKIFEFGTIKKSDEGGVLVDYVEMAKQVAAEKNVLCMNNYMDLGISEDNAEVYLEDEVHLNEYGRFVLGKKLIEILEKFILKN